MESDLPRWASEQGWDSFAQGRMAWSQIFYYGWSNNIPRGSSPMEISLEFSNVPVQQRFESDVEDRIGEVLSPFAERLTRVEVHLRDENAQKGGRDTRCTMEARPRGLDPLAVEAIEEGPREAVRSALGKLQHALGHRFGRLDAKRKK